MKKYILIAAPLLLLAACAQTTPPAKMCMMNGMMSEGCSSCCKEMMKDGTMDMGMMKDGKMQCPMMGNMAKDGAKQKMMAPTMKSAPVKETTDQHHPAK